MRITTVAYVRIRSRVTPFSGTTSAGRGREIHSQDMLLAQSLLVQSGVRYKLLLQLNNEISS
jgi:hypothetical protein